MQPTISYEQDKGYTFTLWRDEKKVVYELNDASLVEIHGVAEVFWTSEDRAKVDGPASNGFIHYIYSEKYSGEVSMVWLSKEEADILGPILYDIKEERYYNELECEFTSTTINDCIKKPENYGPEQRAKIMAYCYSYKLDPETNDLDDECDYCHGAIGRCGGRCKDRDY
jgi:hypothetical protein